MKKREDIELLAPAGSFEALVAAVQNGANAIYLGGQKFGARAFAHNFDYAALKEAVDYCHLRNVKLYVTVNTLYNNAEIDEIFDYLKYLYHIGVDALIIQDMGLFSLIKNHFPDIEIHMSTQASVRNIEGVKYFAKQNIDRVVLAREMNIREIEEICHNCSIDIEVFVHGALCMSYSGQCLMSSMIAKRSGNKGECGQPCRLPYSLLEDNKIIKKQKYLLSPMDLCTIEKVPKLIDAGIKSFKIEGRMKTPFYVGTVIKAYREAIDDYLESPEKYESRKNYYIEEISKASHRDFTTGFYFGKPGASEQVYTNNSYIRDYDFVGMVEEDYDESTGCAVIMQRNKFEVGDELEIFPAKGESVKFTVTEMWDENGVPVQSAPHPKQILRVKLPVSVKKYDMIRKEIKE